MRICVRAGARIFSVGDLGRELWLDRRRRIGDFADSGCAILAAVMGVDRRVRADAVSERVVRAAQQSVVPRDGSLLRSSRTNDSIAHKWGGGLCKFCIDQAGTNFFFVRFERGLTD